MLGEELWEPWTTEGVWDCSRSFYEEGRDDTHTEELDEE